MDHSRSLLRRGCALSAPLRGVAEDDDPASTVDAIWDILQEPPAAALDALGDDVKLYEVVHLNPGGRTLANAAVRERIPSTCISVRELKPIGVIENGRVNIEQGENGILLLDLGKWTTQQRFRHMCSR
eukprot:732983-Pyramimonas_sp.AAC.1